MNVGTSNRLALTVVICGTLAAFSFATDAQQLPQFSYQWEAEAKQDKRAEKDNKQAHQQQQRISKQQQQERIRQQQENLLIYRKNTALRQAVAQRNAQLLQQQKRVTQHQFQQVYHERLRQQQAHLPDDRYDFSNDPFYYTPVNYSYRRDGRSYETNQYGADILRRASNTGYQEGLQAGRADREDNWRFDYKHSFAYKDANYGYDGRYVRQDDYNHYFRQGFQRGYEDGYYDRRLYGTNTNGSDSLLGTVLNAILKLETMQ